MLNLHNCLTVFCLTEMSKTPVTKFTCGSLAGIPLLPGKQHFVTKLPFLQATLYKNGPCINKWTWLLHAPPPMWGSGICVNRGIVHDVIGHHIWRNVLSLAERCAQPGVHVSIFIIHLFETSPFRNHASALDSASGSVLSLDLTQVPIPYHRQKTIILWCSAFPNLFRTRDHDSYTLGTSRMRTGLESSLSSRLKPWARSKNNNNNIEVLYTIPM